MSLIKTFRTVSYLKTGQVTGQIRNRLRFLWERPDRFFQIPNPEFEECQWEANTSFLAPGVAHGNPADNILAGRLVFLNRHESIGWPPADWQASALPKLWQYNLHYFEWLWALDYASIREAIMDWIVRHTLTKDHVGWEPYPTSLRLVNWCAIFFGKFREQTENDDDFVHQLWRSIFIQAQWLCKHLETHLRGNHLFENGAALAFVGSCFSGKAGQDWFIKGLEILNKEILEQILPDGMHFERSPMYHIRMTYLMRLLLDTRNEKLKNLIDKPFTQMQRALACLCHPDGQIAIFNDSAFSIYNNPEDLLGPESTTDSGPWALPDAGYYGYRSDDDSYIVCDAGPIGPDYIPGHAHGDIFSFELSLKGQRVIVDSGVFSYVAGEMRKYCRSTRAHNTVEINGQDQCEFWSAFRVAKRGYPRDIVWKPASDKFYLNAWHDGYKRLPGNPIHKRQVEWCDSSTITVLDKITATKPVRAISRLHLHPHCVIQEITKKQITIRYPAGIFTIETNGECTFKRERTWYCSEFGNRVKNECLCLESAGSDLLFGYKIAIVG